MNTNTIKVKASAVFAFCAAAFAAAAATVTTRRELHVDGNFDAASDLPTKTKQDARNGSDNAYIPG